MINSRWDGGYWNDGLFSGSTSQAIWNDGHFYGTTFWGKWNDGFFHYGYKNGVSYTENQPTKWTITNVQTSIKSPPPAF